MHGFRVILFAPSCVACFGGVLPLSCASPTLSLTLLALASVSHCLSLFFSFALSLLFLFALSLSFAPCSFSRSLSFDLSPHRWAHYVLDSRSIWWSNSRHLVPLLDLINCRGAQRVHATTLDAATGAHADTLAPVAFAKGDQVSASFYM